jgi:Dolichyl-phosphate-mannose-protein mannosyltransferase
MEDFSKQKHQRFRAPYRADSNSTHGLKHWCWADSISILLLIIVAVQLLLSSSRNSATYDEQYHIAIGLHYLRKGDPGLIPTHPPFIAALATLPLLADRNLVVPSRESGASAVSNLEFSDRLLWRLNPNGPAIVARARLPIIGLTLLLAVIVYAWARELFGPMAGLLALTLLSFDPNILAHGNLATSDIGVTCFATLALYTFWRWMTRPTPARAVIAGLALGLAQVSKFSAVYLIPALIIILVSDRTLKSTNASRLTAKTTVAYLTVIALAAYCAIWVVYGLGTLKGYPFPAREYLTGLQAAKTLIGGGKDSFLLGAYSPDGWWYYFPVVFALKTPLPTLILIGATSVSVYRRGTWRPTLPLLIPVVIYFAICLASPFNIGYRHLLPVLPCLFIFTSQLALIDWRTSRSGTAAVSAMVVWLTVGSLAIFPHHLAFFNEIAGGPQNGYKMLVDSNLDWGQELIGLRKYMTQENIGSVKLSYHGTADPTAYGIVYEPLPSYPYNQWTSDTVPDSVLNPPNGVYAISANNLQGLRFKNHDLYATFRQRKPDAVLGHSIFIYRITSTGTGNSAPP